MNKHNLIQNKNSPYINILRSHKNKLNINQLNEININSTKLNSPVKISDNLYFFQFLLKLK